MRWIFIALSFIVVICFADSVTYTGVTLTGVNSFPIPTGGLYFWADSDHVTLDTSVSNTVSSWTDMSYNKFHATQAVKVNQPAYLSNEINGHGALSFRRQSDHNLRSDQVAQAFTGLGDFTVFLVSNTVTNGTLNAAAAGNSINTNPNILFRPCNSAGHSAITLTDDTGTAQVYSKTGAVSNSWQISTFQFTGTNAFCYLGFVANAPVTAYSNGPTTLDVFAIGIKPPNLANPYSGKIAEIIVYDNDIGGTRVTNVVRYLKTKYGL